MRVFLKAFAVGALFGAASAMAAPLAFSQGGQAPQMSDVALKVE